MLNLKVYLTLLQTQPPVCIYDWEILHVIYIHNQSSGPGMPQLNGMVVGVILTYQPQSLKVFNNLTQVVFGVCTLKWGTIS